MVKKRNNGEGALFKNHKGLWEARVELPPDPETGKRRRKIVTSKKQAVALAKLKAIRADLAGAGDLPTATPTLAKWVETTWLPSLQRQKLKPSTINGYESKFRLYIAPVIGEVKIDKIGTRHVHQVLDYMRSKGLSSTSARYAHITLNKIMKDAVRRGLTVRNPCDQVDRPIPAVTEKPALSPGQAVQVMQGEAEMSQEVRAMLALMLYTGARKAEALGLRVEYVDFNLGLISFEWTLQRLTWKHGCGGTCGRKRGADCPDRHIPIADGVTAKQVAGTLWLTTPKSKKSKRIMPMALPLARELATLIHEKNLKPGDFILGENGKPMRPEDFYQTVKAALASAGEEFSPHSLRHTASTLYDAAGVPEDRRIAMMGHSSAQMTRRYTHTSMDTLAGDVSALTRFLESTASEER